MAFCVSHSQVVQELLCEMNDDVAGSYQVKDLDGVLADDAAMLAGFTMVVATQLAFPEALRLAAACEARGVPLIVSRPRMRGRLHSLPDRPTAAAALAAQLARSYGLLGSVRLCVQNHAVFNSKRPEVQADLRVSDPFPELLVRPCGHVRRVVVGRVSQRCTISRPRVLGTEGGGRGRGGMGQDARLTTAAPLTCLRPRAGAERCNGRDQDDPRRAHEGALRAAAAAADARVARLGECAAACLRACVPAGDGGERFAAHCSVAAAAN